MVHQRNSSTVPFTIAFAGSIALHAALFLPLETDRQAATTPVAGIQPLQLELATEQASATTAQPAMLLREARRKKPFRHILRSRKKMLAEARLSEPPQPIATITVPATDMPAGGEIGQAAGHGKNRTDTLASPQSPDDTELTRYLAELHDAIAARRHYPARARRYGDEGVVTVAMTITGSGLFTKIHVSEPSASSLLNRAATDTVRKLARFRPLPDALARDVLHVEVPLAYRLEQS